MLARLPWQKPCKQLRNRAMLCAHPHALLLPFLQTVSASLMAQVKLVPADKAPKRGKGGSLASRQAMLHALVHIENSAIDLAW